MSAKLTLVILMILICYYVPVSCWLDAITKIRTYKKPKMTQDVNSRKNNEVCRKDRHCKATMFCHRYERVCMSCRTEGQMCRRNKMCCRGMECAGGKCRKKIELGRLGALCTKDRDCNYNLCCARENGQSVCKPMLQQGETCGVREGGQQFLWSHQCPCAYGLKCKAIAKKKSNRNTIRQIQRDWVGGTTRVCVRHHKVS